MQLFMTLLVLVIWLYIGWYGIRASRKRGQTTIAGAWALLTTVIAIYIVSTLFI